MFACVIQNEEFRPSNTNYLAFFVYSSPFTCFNEGVYVKIELLTVSVLIVFVCVCVFVCVLCVCVCCVRPREGTAALIPC